jgi:cytochrome oxidase Cu insertion factor (SCO1/SenC/PrrC family)
VEDRLTREERLVIAAAIAWFAITAAWWLLALWPVADAPAWLERTRYVCFGINETGLPDGGGWIGLTAGPLGMLSILVIGWSGAFASALRKRLGVLALMPVIVGCMVLAFGAWTRVAAARSFDPNEGPVATLPPASYPRLGLPMPALGLVTQNGERFSVTQAAGRPMLVTFAYAHCTTVCPVVVKQALEAQRMLRGTPAEPAVLIITLDPWRDTPARLPSMAKAWQLPAAGAWIMSGAVDEVENVLTQWQVPRTRDESTGDVTHPSMVYVVDRDRRIAFASTGGSENLAALLRRL